MTAAPTYTPFVPRRDWLILAAVLLVAAAFRLIGLEETPPGLWRDEAGYALAAQDVLAGRFQMYWGDKEPFFPYVLAGVFAVVGASPVTLRATAALFGVATVGVTFLLGRRLFGTTAGAVAAAGLATVFWTVDLNRVGFRVSTMPFVISLAFLFLWRALDGGRRRDWLIAGVLVGLTPYTYLAARLAPVVAILTLLLFARRLKPFDVSLFVAAMLATFAPLGVFYVVNPSYFSDRVSQLSPFAAARSPLEILAVAGRGLLDTAGMFFVRGDNEPRHNLPGRPVFDPLMATLFVGGIGVALARLRVRRVAFVLIWLVGLLVPSALAVDNPHYLRTLGASPAALLLVGLGASVLIDAAGRRRTLAIGVITALLVISAGWTARDYFLVWARSPQTAAFFESGVVNSARLIAARPGVAGLLSTPFSPHPSVQLLTSTDPVWFDGAEGLIGVDGPADYALPASNDAAIDLLGALYPAATQRRLGDAVAFDVPSGVVPRWPVLTPRSARFGSLLEVTGVELPAGAIRPGFTITPTIQWRVLGPTERPDLALFVHAIDSTGRRVAQHDGVTYPSDQWRGGEQGVSWFPLTFPADAAPGPYRLVAGLYPRGTLQRLPVTENGVPAGDTLTIGTVLVPVPEVAVDPAIRLDRRFGESIDLRGVDLQGCAPLRPPCTIDLTIYWRASAPVGDDLTVFVHFAAEDGRPVATADGAPVNGQYPTTVWRAGETVVDPRRLMVPADLPPGRYRLLVGLYRLGDGVRVREASGADSVQLAAYQAGGQP